jgi:hypothetical protein
MSIQKRHNLADRGNDLYESPSEAVHALLDLERSGEIDSFPQNIWEPACGPGSIVRVLRGAGYTVTATDLVDYGARKCLESQSGVDFLMEGQMIGETKAIITNPPYKLANDFVRHAHRIGAPRIIMLLRAMFIEGTGRTDVIENMGLASVHVFRNRLTMMHRDGFDGPKNGSNVPFAWFDWRRDYDGPINLGRVSWRPKS